MEKFTENSSILLLINNFVITLSVKVANKVVVLIFSRGCSCYLTVLVRDQPTSGHFREGNQRWMSENIYPRI